MESDGKAFDIDGNSEGFGECQIGDGQGRHIRP
jgi:hypothetical protein